MWICPECTFSNHDDVDVCAMCRHSRVAAPDPDPGPGNGRDDSTPPTRRRYGWRMILPNHTIVPLEVTGRPLVVGRASEGPIGRVLQLFGQVSQEQLTLEVRDDSLTIFRSERATNPTFEFPAAVDANDPLLQSPPGVLPRRRDLRAGESVELCLAQCCFIRIERGEA